MCIFMVYQLTIHRQRLFDQIQGALEHNRVVGCWTRQCQTTMARRIVAPDSLNYFDLEDSRHLQRLEHPMNALESLRARWSSMRSRGGRNSSRRCACLSDVGPENRAAHWLRGGYPLSFLAGSDGLSGQWRRDFTQTFLERDVPQFGFSIPAATLGRFWTMAAHYHGQVCNGAGDQVRSRTDDPSEMRGVLGGLRDRGSAPGRSAR